MAEYISGTSAPLGLGHSIILAASDSDIRQRRHGVSRWEGVDGKAEVQDAWGFLLQTQDPIIAVHQTAAYIRHLAEVGKRPEILLVREIGTERVTGVVPIRQTTYSLSFAVRGGSFPKFRLRSMIILGSEPMVAGSDALDAVFSFIGDNYPDVDVLDLYSVPEDGAFWRYLSQSDVVARHFSPYVVGGFRESYSMAVPSSVAEYSAKLTKKRRYNFRRQERLLEEHLGPPLCLTMVDQPALVPALLDALGTLGVSTGPETSFTAYEYRSACGQGILLSYILTSGTHIVGVATGIRSEHTYFIHQFYFDKSLEKFSPGTTLWQLVLRYLIEQGVYTRVGLSYGNPAYRFHEINLIEKKGRVLLYRRTTANRSRFLAHSAYLLALEAAKRRLKAISARAKALKDGGLEGVMYFCEA